MDKHFHDLLGRYIKGTCTEEESEKINQWYEKIQDRGLELDKEERILINGRMLAHIRKSLPAQHKSLKHFHLSRFPIMKVAAAVVLLVACGFAIFLGMASLPDNRLAEIPKLSGEVIFENQSDGDKMYSLPDGSTVQLESFGKVRFSKRFSSGKREVYLTGKAFFDVVKDPSRPFYVYSGQIATRVLGTSFFVDAPANAKKVEVKVITGKVSVFQIQPDCSPKNEKPSALKNSATNGVVLSPNEKVEYFVDNNHWVTGLVEEPVPVKAIDERTLSFVFDRTPLKVVLKDINERFGIEVVMENERIAECTFTGDVSKMALYDMLDVISNSIGSTYEVKGIRILVRGKGCDMK